MCFVRNDLYPAPGLADHDIDAMRLDAGPRIMHGYDGTIFTASLDYLPGINIAVTPEDLQILPRALPRYHDAPDGTRSSLGDHADRRSISGHAAMRPEHARAHGREKSGVGMMTGTAYFTQISDNAGTSSFRHKLFHFRYPNCIC